MAFGPIHHVHLQYGACIGVESPKKPLPSKKIKKGKELRMSDVRSQVSLSKIFQIDFNISMTSMSMS
jgi:hypothetical protein